MKLITKFIYSFVVINLLYSLVCFSNAILYNTSDLSSLSGKIVTYQSNDNYNGKQYIMINKLPQYIYDIKLGRVEEISNGNQFVAYRDDIDKNAVIWIYNIEWNGNTAVMSKGADSNYSAKTSTINNKSSSNIKNKSNEEEDTDIEEENIENNYNEDGWVQSGSNWKYIMGGEFVKDDEITDENGNSYYINSNGNMATNKWVETKYYGSDGKRIENGWKQINSYWYYFDNGDIVTDQEMEIDGKLYHFTEKGNLKTSGKSDDGYTINSDGSINVQ